MQQERNGQKGISFINFTSNCLHERVDEYFHSCFDKQSNFVGPTGESIIALWKLQEEVSDLIDQIQENFNTNK